MAGFRRKGLGFRLPARFRRDESGATAVEFGFVALPFFALMFAIVETGLAFFASQVLETAVGDASRLIMTGQAQATQNFNITSFKNQICDRLPAMFDCQGKLQVDVRSYQSFPDGGIQSPLTGDGEINWNPGSNPPDANPKFLPGSASDIVIVRAIYPLPTYTNFYGRSLGNTSDGDLLLMSTAAFRNEPFPTSAAPSS